MMTRVGRGGQIQKGLQVLTRFIYIHIGHFYLFPAAGRCFLWFSEVRNIWLPDTQHSEKDLLECGSC